jgi:hypothetical protein
LLRTGNNELTRRAFDIIEKILSLQDTNPYSATYGIWSWLYEEPLDQMSPPDWNWADFIGAALGHVLKEFGSQLPNDLRRKTEAGLGHAAWSIFRRNMQPHYTNIAIMGCVVTAVAGEMLNEPRLLDYARIRLNAFNDYTMEQEGLNEYNSPCYTFVALHEFERIIQLVDDPDIVACAEKLRRYVWKCLADHYHPATKQLAGPHSRAYSDLLKQAAQTYLKWAVSGKDFGEFEYEQVEETVIPLPCPDEYVNRFKSLPEMEIIQCDTFIKRDSYPGSVCGTTWMNEQVTLGSINRECFWTQRRPLIGYWLDEAGNPAVLRLRMLKDGKDFSSGGLRNVQDRNKVITGVNFFVDRGDFHIHLDKPEDGIFKMNSLLLRFELTGKGAVINNASELKCGNWKAVVKTLPGEFYGKSVQWRSGSHEDCVYLEAVLYEGAETDLLIDESTCIKLALATEILPEYAVASIENPELNEFDGQLKLSSGNMSLTYNHFAENYD